MSLPERLPEPELDLTDVPPMVAYRLGQLTHQIVSQADNAARTAVWTHALRMVQTAVTVAGADRDRDGATALKRLLDAMTQASIADLEEAQHV